MHGVIFNGMHSWRDWGLWLKSRPVISPPKPKLKLIPVPGSDKVIDLTEHLSGRVNYEMREIKLEFITAAPRDMWAELHSRIMNHMHGRSVSIIFDDDPSWVYTGRVQVGDMEGDKKTASLSVTATVEPYKKARNGEERRL